MINKDFRSVLQDDCDKLFKKFNKLATELAALNKGISDEYLMQLPQNERDFIMERALKLHLQFVPMIQLRAATGKYLDYVDNILKGLHKEPQTEVENEMD